MKASCLNPNAPAYIPGGLIYGKDGPSGVLAPRAKTSVPTAKVPNYVKRLGQSVRDNKPGLLPTPDIPPMRAGVANGFGFLNPYGVSCRSWSMDVGDHDPYSTPYSTRLRRRDVDIAPPGFDLVDSSSYASPPGFHQACVPADVKGDDSLESLLALLSQQLESSTGYNSSGVSTVGSSSVSSSAVPPSTPSKLVAVDPSDILSAESLWDPKRMETFDSEQSLLASIAGFYLPSDMN
jgi:hypothetical protein